MGLKLGVEAAAFDGQIGGGFYFFGYEVKVGLEGSAIVAGTKVALSLSVGTWFDIGKRK